MTGCTRWRWRSSACLRTAYADGSCACGCRQGRDMVRAVSRGMGCRRGVRETSRGPTLPARRSSRRPTKILAPGDPRVPIP